MHTLKSIIAASTVAGAAFIATVFTNSALAADAPGRCAPQLVSSKTEFPLQSQTQGQHGVVRLAFALNAAGRAEQVRVTQSSGHRTLDRAAADSLRSAWQFDVANCTAADLAAAQTVDVTFRPTARQTLSGSVDGKSIAATRTLAANAQCHQTQDEAGTAIFACVKSGSHLENALARK